MVIVVAFIAVLVGTDAATKLNRAHPTPAAWFEAAITVVLVIADVVIYIVRGDDG